jgi:hypothetical protein
MKRRFVCVALFLALPAFAMRAVKDELGGEVKIPDHPHRLVCLMPNVGRRRVCVGARFRGNRCARFHKTSRRGENQTQYRASVEPFNRNHSVAPPGLDPREWRAEQRGNDRSVGEVGIRRICSESPRRRRNLRIDSKSGESVKCGGGRRQIGQNLARARIPNSSMLSGQTEHQRLLLLLFHLSEFKGKEPDCRIWKLLERSVDVRTRRKPVSSCLAKGNHRVYFRRAACWEIASQRGHGK